MPKPPMKEFGGSAGATPDNTGLPVEPKPSPSPGGGQVAQPVAMAQPPAGEKSAPRLTASVKWEFKEGSSQFGVITPHRWRAAVSVAPADGRTWTAMPDLVVGEATGDNDLAQGVSELGQSRPDFTFFGSRSGGSIPADTSGKVSLMLAIDGSLIFGQEVKRDWQLNGKSVLWKPTPLGRTDRLDCVWENATGETFKASAKAKADFRPFHLGPLVYDAADPDGPCYALAAFGEKAKDRQNEWVCEKPELIPLTDEAIRKEVMNPGRPDAWRFQFLVWYWSQPRPLKDAGEILLRELKGKEYSKVMKLSAAAGLVALKYQPAFPVVIALVRDKAENEVFREKLLEVPDVHTVIGVGPLTAIARDVGDKTSVREAALDALENHGDAGWAVIRAMKDDKVIGPKATKMLAEQHKK